MINYQDLNDCGYVVVPNFLTGGEINILKGDYNTSTTEYGKYGGIKVVSTHVIHEFTNKLLLTLADIRKTSLVKADTIIYPGIYVNNKKMVFPWHQEHESWYLENNSINHLNFYIPIKKEYSNKSGISLIPNNALQDYSINIINKGARRFFPGENSTFVIDDDLDDSFNLPFNIENHAVSPDVLPGDLLLMRGDVIHRTQDNETERHAVSFRCTFGNNMINKTRLFSGSKAKLEYLDNNKQMYSKINSIFGDEDNIVYSRLSSELNKG